MYRILFVLLFVTNSIAFALQGTRREWPVEPPVPARIPPNLSFEGLDQYPDYDFYLSFSNTKGTSSFPAWVEYKKITESTPFTTNPRFIVEEYRVWAYPKSEIDRLKLRGAFYGAFESIKGGASVLFSPPPIIQLVEKKQIPADIAKVYQYRVKLEGNQLSVTLVDTSKQNATPNAKITSEPQQVPREPFPIWTVGGIAIGLFIFGVVLGRFIKWN